MTILLGYSNDNNNHNKNSNDKMLAYSNASGGMNNSDARLVVHPVSGYCREPSFLE